MGEFANAQFTISPNKSTFQSHPLMLETAALALADLNGDGKLDLVVANGYTGDYSLNYSQGSSVEVFLGLGDGTFHASSAYGVVSNAQGITIADVDGDGKPDLLVTNGFSSTFTVLLGRGDGTFTTGNSYATQAAPSAIAVADFNGDGKRDVVVANSQSGTLSVFLGNGNGTFGTPTIVPVDVGLLSVIAADFNGDGRPDLAVATTSGIYALAGLGNGTFAPPAWLNFGASPASLVAVDLDGDGRLDLIFTYYDGGSAAVFLNVGAAGAGATIATQTGTPQSAAINAPFATPMSVLVRSAASQPLPGQTVIFSAPPVGASGYFAMTGSPEVQVTTDGGGIAVAPAFVANATPGTFGLLASIGSASTSFALTVTGTANLAPAFLSAPLPNGVLNAPYAYAVTASGSPAPTLSAVANSLPPGLTLDGSTGLVAGRANHRRDLPRHADRDQWCPAERDAAVQRHDFRRDANDRLRHDRERHVRRAAVRNIGDRNLGTSRRLLVADTPGLHDQRQHGDDRSPRYVHDSGVAGRQFHLRAGAQREPQLHRRQAPANDRLRRALQSQPRKRSLYGRRNGVVRIGRRIFVADRCGLHGERDHGHAGRDRNVHDSGGAGRQRDVRCRAERRSKLHRQAGRRGSGSRDHIQGTGQQQRLRGPRHHSALRDGERSRRHDRPGRVLQRTDAAREHHRPTLQLRVERRGRPVHTTSPPRPTTISASPRQPPRSRRR